MEVKILLVTGIFFLSLGGYQILKEVFHVARSRDQKRIRKAFNHRKESDFLLTAAQRLGRFLPMAESQKKRMAQ